MKQFACAIAALVLASWITSAGAKTPPGDSSRPSGVYAKGVELSGKVSADGKSFLADDGNQWTINNTAAVKGREARSVIVKCRMDLDKRAIHVLSVREEQADLKNGARLGDPAFRR